MTITELVDRYKNNGNDRFYRFLLSEAIDKLIKIQAGNEIQSPELSLLENADRFLQLYRKTNLQVYLDISRCLRKAGHKIYRLMLKKSLIKRNARFLQVV